jgi:hypothetical protein
MLRLLGITTILTAALFAACNPYDPDLGQKPYRCGTSEPKCPDGYEAVDVGPPNICECVLDGDTGGDTPDAAGGCAADPGEPNDSPASATATPIGAGATTAEFNNKSICTITDVDTYAFSSATANQMMTATLTFSPQVGQLFVKIIDSQGILLGMGTMQGSNMIATATLPTQGTYYVQVGSTNGTNTYGLSMALQ